MNFHRTEFEKFINDNWSFGEGHPAHKLGEELSAQGLRDLFIVVAGLNGETGEVTEKLKKYIRDGTFNRRDILLECGDVLAYLVRLVYLMDSDLEEVMQLNMDKLRSRRERGTSRGSGDNR